MRGSITLIRARGTNICAVVASGPAYCTLVGYLEFAMSSEKRMFPPLGWRKVKDEEALA